MPFSYPSVTLEDGLTLYFKATIAARKRIAAAGVDFCKPPQITDWDAFERYVIVVSAACAYVEIEGELRPADLSPEALEELAGDQDVAFLKEAVNQAIRHYNANLALGAKAWEDLQTGHADELPKFGAGPVPPVVM